MPIFIGLWQGLQSAVELRQSPFVLWIDNLSAPDMLFPLPLDKLPLVGGYLGPYFNLLPILVVGLMILQQKLFTPPATDPQMESQQKMMSYMMVLFAVFFYKFPSGLCLYIIASTSWALMERKLVPKMQHATEPPPSEEKGKRGGGGRGGGGRPGRDGKGPRPSSDNGSKWTDKLNELIKRASKR
jgi:YidC/Oxa1 family membrane protein insertase